MFFLQTGNKTVLSIRTEIWICLFFIISIFLLYFQVIHHSFTSFDDKLYVTGNPDVLKGFTSDSFARAFKFTEKGDLTYWHPLSTISHMIDYELFGLQSGGHHFSNLCIHLLNTLLLFLLFSSMTQKIWQSAFMAALFAFHPINVDTIAWIAERKNLLSTFFWLLTMLTYLFYCRKPGFHTYISVILCMITGLLCKPMLVTLPCVLLLMDFWPLERIKRSPSFRIQDNIHLILEKIPLFALSIIWTQLSSLSMQRLNVEIPIDQNPIDIRIANAIITYVKYIQKIVWPYNLAIYYPFPQSMPPTWQIIFALIFLSLMTFLMFSFLKNMPWLTIGWLWYFGTLIPVIGLLQNGLWPEMADRWAYIPTIGLFIIIAWGVPALLAGLQKEKFVISMFSAAFLIIIVITTWNQIKYWSSNQKLFSHAIEVTKNNPVSQYNLANEFQNEKNYLKAINHYNEALKMKPDAAKIHNNLGNAYAKIKKYEKAITHYNESLKLESDVSDTHNNIGNAFLHLSQFEKALYHYTKAIQIDPKSETSYFNMGLLLEKQNKHNMAINYFSKSIQLKPDNAEAHLALGNSLVEVGRLIDAEKHYSEAIALDSTIEDAKINLSIIKKFQKEFEIELAAIKDDIKQSPKDHKLYYRLGELYEKNKKQNTAIIQYKKATSLQPYFIPALKKLAILYATMEEYENSIFYFKKMIEIQPEDNSLYYNIACVYSKQNNIKESIKWLSQSIDKGYNNWNLIQNDKDLENVRKASDFKILLKRK
jgi:protein O-mannosyl-transferase